MKARVLGRNVQLFVNSAKWLAPIALGELEEFTATSTTELIKSRPIGYSLEAATLRYGGYDLTLKIAKTDPFMARWAYLVDRGLISGGQAPELFIIEMIKHYDPLSIPGGFAGTGPGGGEGGAINLGHITEHWIYKNVTLFAPEFGVTAQEEYTQSIKGFAAYKELAPDTTLLKLDWIPQLGFQEVVIKTKDIGGSLIEDVTSAINSALNKPKPEQPKQFVGDVVPSIPTDFA